MQLISFDIEKAFDKTSHIIIEQALQIFGFPPILIQAIKNLALTGIIQIEVNGNLSEGFTIKVGSGQGDPISSILFLIATEPLNRTLLKHLVLLFYATQNLQKHGLLLFADDNLALMNLKIGRAHV